MNKSWVHWSVVCISKIICVPFRSFFFSKKLIVHISTSHIIFLPGINSMTCCVETCKSLYWYTKWSHNFFDSQVISPLHRFSTSMIQLKTSIGDFWVMNVNEMFLLFMTIRVKYKSNRSILFYLQFASVSLLSYLWARLQNQ